MFGRAIWDKLPECIFENFEIREHADWMFLKYKSDIFQPSPPQSSIYYQPPPILAYLPCFHLLQIIITPYQITNFAWIANPLLIRPPAIKDVRVGVDV